MRRKHKDPLASRRTERPVPYWLPHRWSDWRAGRVDGRADILAAYLADIDLPAQPVEDRFGPPAALFEVARPEVAPSRSAYQGALDQRYRGQAEQVCQAVDQASKAMLAQLRSVRGKIPLAETRLARVRAELEAMPVTAPDHVLERRTVVEQHAEELLVWARNQRDWDVVRAGIARREREIVLELEGLNGRAAELIGDIQVVRRIGATRVRRLHRHSLRRSRTYERRLVLNHTDGSRLTQLLAIGRSELPGWAHQYDPDHADLGQLHLVNQRVS